MDQLSPEVLFAIAIAGSVIVWGIKLALKGKPISDAALTTGVYVVSVVLAFLFQPVVLPPLPPYVDLATFIPALISWLVLALVPVSAFVGFATLIYQALLKRVLDG